MSLTDSPAPSTADGRKLSTAKAMVEGIAMEMERDEDVFVLGEDVEPTAVSSVPPRVCSTGSGPTASWTRPFPRPRSSARPSERPWKACDRSSS